MFQYKIQLSAQKPWHVASKARSKRSSGISNTEAVATRRNLLASGLILPSLLAGSSAGFVEDGEEASPLEQAQARCQRLGNPNYAEAGPFRPVHLPRIKRTCSKCFPQCVAERCLLRVSITYPKGGQALGIEPPYPLAIISSGFLIGSDSYQSYAERLASWGYSVIRYDKSDNITESLDDIVSVAMIRDLIDWAGSSAVMQQLADPSRGVYLVGHSRGGKLSALAAAEDPRVAAICLIDPVDNTVYAPLGPAYPSGVAALQQASGKRGRFLPVAVVGAGISSDCVPAVANHVKFYEGCGSAAMDVVLSEAGHFQFLDNESALQRAVCDGGDMENERVRRISQAVMVAWGEAMVRGSGRPVTRLGDPYPPLCRQPGAGVGRGADAARGGLGVLSYGAPGGLMGAEEQSEGGFGGHPALPLVREELERLAGQLRGEASVGLDIKFRNFTSGK